MTGTLATIRAKRKTGCEPIRRPGNRGDVGTLLGFWQWAGSDLVGNTVRGWLAEYLVALDLGIADGARTEWAPHDLTMADRTRVEVKTSAYVQSWSQKGHSTPRFSIRPAIGWGPEGGFSANPPERSSDVYVFCLHKHRDQATICPLDGAQWNFFVVPTKVIDARLGNQKTVGISTLCDVGARQSPFGEIKKTISTVLGGMG